MAFHYRNWFFLRITAQVIKARAVVVTTGGWDRKMVDPPLHQDESSETASMSSVGGASNGTRPRQRRRLRFAIASCALVVLAIALVAVVLTGGGGSGPATRVRTGHATLERADQLRLQAALASQDQASFVQALAPTLRPALGDPRSSMLPPGSTVTLVAASFKQRGNVATITANVRGPQPGQFTVLLTREAGHWLVLGTGRS